MNINRVKVSHRQMIEENRDLVLKADVIKIKLIWLNNFQIQWKSARYIFDVKKQHFGLYHGPWLSIALLASQIWLFEQNSWLFNGPKKLHSIWLFGWLIRAKYQIQYIFFIWEPRFKYKNTVENFIYTVKPVRLHTFIHCTPPYIAHLFVAQNKAYRFS